LDDIYNSSDKVVAESWSETHLSSGFVSPYNGLFGNLNAGVTIDPCRLQCSLIDFPAWSDTQIKKWKAIKLEYPPDGNPQRNNVFAFLIANGNPLNPIKFNAVQTITCYGFQLTPNYLLEMKTLDNDYPPVPAIIKKKSE
jgi:hypothetical protein